MLKNFKILILLVFFFISINASKADTLEQLSEELNDVKNELSNLSSSNVKEAITIDKVVQNLDAIVEFANESAKNNPVLRYVFFIICNLTIYSILLYVKKP